MTKQMTQNDMASVAKITSTRQQAMTLAAARYAAADRTDLFAYRRAIAHMRNGVAQFGIEQPDGTQIKGYYDADGYDEGRSYPGPDGKPVAYTVRAYRNIIRP